MNLREPVFTCSACGQFSEKRGRIKSLKEIVSRYIYGKEPDKACFQLDMAYGFFKNLSERTASDKVLRDEALNITKNPKYGYQRGLVLNVYKLFDKKSPDGALTHANKSAIKSKIMPCQELSEEIHKLITRKFEKRKV